MDLTAKTTQPPTQYIQGGPATHLVKRALIL